MLAGKPRRACSQPGALRTCFFLWTGSAPPLSKRLRDKQAAEGRTRPGITPPCRPSSQSRGIWFALTLVSLRRNLRGFGLAFDVPVRFRARSMGAAASAARDEFAIVRFKAG